MDGEELGAKLAEQMDRQSVANYPRCRTCTHFRREGTGGGKCSNPAFEDGQSKPDRDGMTVGWSQTTGGEISVGEDFGCVQHKPAEAPMA